MPAERPTGRARARRALAELPGRSLNFDPEAIEHQGPATGWRVDRYRARLPAEEPGPPEPGGSFETARRLMREYAFADPAMVRAIFDPAGPLEQRNMLLEVRFAGLRLYVGCRVGSVVDEQREVDGRPVAIWGWSYGTLEGHFERGRMSFEVRKHLDDGTAEFRIDVISRAAGVRNPFVALGLRLVGRRNQVRFARRACERMVELVSAEVGSRHVPPVPASRPPPGRRGHGAARRLRLR